MTTNMFGLDDSLTARDELYEAHYGSLAGDTEKPAK